MILKGYSFSDICYFETGKRVFALVEGTLSIHR